MGSAAAADGVSEAAPSSEAGSDKDSWLGSCTSGGWYRENLTAHVDKHRQLDGRRITTVGADENPNHHHHGHMRGERYCD